MNNRIKNNVLLVIIFATGCLLSTNAMAQIDHRFNYQGELMDGGVPANGSYDITVSPFFFLEGGSVQGIVSTNLNVNVSDGLFTLNNVNIVDPTGVDPFDGASLYLEIAVRQTGVAAAYTTMSPRQRIHAVPYADNITRKGAVNGQILTFNGNTWEPTTNPESPWMLNASGINFSDNVGIGTNNPSVLLHVKSSFVLPAIFDGDDRMFVEYRENGTPRGYVGSYYDEVGSNIEDFEIGTSLSNSVGNMHISTQATPRITVEPEGDVGIGTTNPTETFTVDGETMHKGNVYQSFDANGGLKYMVKATCGMTGSSIIRSYTGTLGSTLGPLLPITIANGPTSGRCTITFPTLVFERYWVVSPDSDGNISANCKISGNSSALFCRSYTSNTGAGLTSDITVLVY